MSTLPKTIRWNYGELYFLDQTMLPHKVVEEKQERNEIAKVNVNIIQNNNKNL